MRFRKEDFKCPLCGELPIGTGEVVNGVALLLPPEDDGQTVRVEYGGETEIDWDSQETIREEENGEIVLVCPSRHDWWVKPLGDDGADEAAHAS